jgi:hypothetical protein
MMNDKISENKFNKKYFMKCIDYSLFLFYNAYHKNNKNKNRKDSNQKVVIPSAEKFINFFHMISKKLSKTQSQSQSNIKPKKEIYLKKDLGLNLVPQQNIEIMQHGGLFGYEVDFNIVLKYLKPMLGSILGVADETKYGACAYFETSLNILIWAMSLYVSFLGINLENTGEISFTNKMINELLLYLTGPNDYVLSLVPGLNPLVYKLTFGKLCEYVVRIFNDFTEIYTNPSNTLNITLILIKLIKVNGLTYEKLFIQPIICIVSTVWVECRKRCIKNSEANTGKNKSKVKTKTRRTRRTKTRKTRK